MTRILVVEDEADIRLLTRVILSGAGHDVTEVESGEAALDMLAAEHFDVVLLDIRLPGIDGWEVLEKLNAMPGRTGAVVVMSAHSSGHALERAKGLGCRDYILKPFTRAAILAAVDLE